MIPTFQRLKNASDQLFTRLQQNIQAVLDPLVATPIVQGQRVTYTAPAAVPPNTNFYVGHGLGRPVLGVLVPLATGFAAWFSISPSANPDPDNIVVLQSNVAIPAGQILNFWAY